ncbi:MAG TPA: hypothetical protein VF981_11125 [Gemmatimonadaceae bacterium]
MPSAATPTTSTSAPPEPDAPAHGEPSPQKRRAKASLTTATGRDSARSVASMARPARMAMPIVSKYRRLTALARNAIGSPGAGTCP